MDQALAAQKSGDKPLCVVTDVDDTLILHPDYWGSMIATKHDAFDDPMWDEPIKQDKLTTAPGAVVFLNYCKSKGVEVFYVTSLDQQDARPPLLIKSRKKQEVILKRFIVFVQK